MLLAGAIILWRMANRLLKNDQTTKDITVDSKVFLNQIVEMALPVSYFAAAMGLALISIAIAGVYFQLFAAPPEEPISGRFADYPMLEASFYLRSIRTYWYRSDFITILISESRIICGENNGCFLDNYGYTFYFIRRFKLFHSYLFNYQYPIRIQWSPSCDYDINNKKVAINEATFYYY